MTFAEFKLHYKFTLEVLESNNLVLLMGKVKRRDNNLTIASLKYEVDIESARDAEMMQELIVPFSVKIAKDTSKRMMLNYFTTGYEINDFDAFDRTKYPDVNVLFEL
jgi:hypothetical protein